MSDTQTRKTPAPRAATAARGRRAPAAASARGVGSVKTAARTIDVFEVFAELKRPLSLSEIAAHIGAPASSCHALLRTLRDRGYLYPVGGQKKLYPTRRLADLWEAIAVGDPVLPRLAEALALLRGETSETVIVGKLQDRAVVYLEVLEGPQTIRYTARAGELRPLHSSSIGKALLGEMPRAERDELLKSTRLPKITPSTLVDRAKLHADIELGRERGYFVTEGENVVDVMGVAICLSFAGDSVGLALAGPVDRMRENLPRHLRALQRLRRSVETSQ